MTKEQTSSELVRHLESTSWQEVKADHLRLTLDLPPIHHVVAPRLSVKEYSDSLISNSYAFIGSGRMSGLSALAAIAAQRLDYFIIGTGLMAMAYSFPRLIAFLEEKG